MGSKRNNQILCSTGAIGFYPVQADIDLMLDVFPRIAADGYEVMIDRAVMPNAAAWSARLRAAGIPVPMVHIGKATGELLATDDAQSRAAGLDKLAVDLDIVQMFGARHAVLHLWGYPGSDRFFAHTLDVLADALALAEQADVELLVETIPCVQRPLLARLQELHTAFPRLRLTIDSRLMALAGAVEDVMAADWLWASGCVAHVHVSDCRRNADGVCEQRPILQPRDGCIDFAAFFAALRRYDYAGAVTLEAPAVDPATRAVDTHVLNRSLHYIRAALNA